MVKKVYVTYQCTKDRCGHRVKFLDKSGFKNPYRHLLSCHGKGKPASQHEKILIDKYEDARSKAAMEGGSILRHFQAASMNDYEKALAANIRLLVCKNLPLTLVSDPEFRAFSRYPVPISYATTVSVLRELVKLVENRIASEMKQTKGALLFDGWSSGDVHYVAGIASYCATVAGDNTIQPLQAVLSVSPMGKCRGTEDPKSTIEEEANRFDAETHLEFFRKTFDFYKLSFDDWVVCLVCDNAKVNRRMARLSRKPCIGCKSHLLNLQVNSMVSKDSMLASTVDSVQETMKSAKKLKNAATLRNVTDYRPILNN